MRSRRGSLGFVLAIALLGCQPSLPTRPAGVKPSPTASARASQAPASPTPPSGLFPSLPPTGAPIVSHNGSSLAGTVKAPASLVSNNGGSVISNGGNNYRTLAALSQVPVANAPVKVRDAAGKVLAEGKTGADGSYGFTSALPDQNLVVEVTLPDAKGTLQAIAPRGAKRADADLVSTLTTGYILDQYVKPQQDPNGTFDKLPAAMEADTRAKAAAALEGGTAAVPQALTAEQVVATVESLRKSNAAFDAQLTEVKTLLVIGTTSGAVTDGDALKARLSQPRGLTFDAAGNLYVADEDDYLIRKLTPDGKIATVAGSGQITDKDGKALEAGFWHPEHVGFDAAGNLYIAQNMRLRKLSKDGVVSTVAGTGVAAVKDGPGATAQFSAIRNLAVMPDGTCYVRDGGTIRKVATDGTVTTLQDARFKSPSSLAADAAGNLYVTRVGADAEICKLTPAGAFTVMPAPGKVFPYRIAVVPDGTIYYADDNSVAKLTPDGTVTFLAGDEVPGYADGTGMAAKFNGISGIAADAQGNVFVSDTENRRLRKVSPTGVVTTVAGTGEGRTQDGEGSQVLFGHVYDVANAPDGGFYVTDPENNVVRKISATGVVSTFAGTGVSGHANGTLGTATFDRPQSVLVGEDGTLYVSEARDIRTIAPDGTVGTLAADPAFNTPGGMDFDADGNLIVVDAGVSTAKIFRVTRAGVVTQLASFVENVSNIQAYYELVVDPAGTIYCTDTYSHRIVAIDAAGTVSTFAGGNGAGSTDGPRATAQFNKPVGLTRDPVGNLYVTDFGANQVRKIAADGTVSRLPIEGLSLPFGLTLTPDGRLAVCDAGNRQVKFFDLP